MDKFDIAQPIKIILDGTNYVPGLKRCLAFSRVVDYVGMLLVILQNPLQK